MYLLIRVISATYVFSVSRNDKSACTHMQIIIDKAPRAGLTHWPLGDFNLNIRKVIFKLTSVNGGWGISYVIALRWMPLDLTDDKSTLAQVMAWCHQATSNYLSQCWPRSLSPYCVIRPQWVKLHFPTKFMLRGFVLMVVVVFQKVRPSPDKFVKPAAPGPAEKGSLIFPSQQKSPQKQEGNPS